MTFKEKLEKAMQWYLDQFKVDPHMLWMYAPEPVKLVRLWEKHAGDCQEDQSGV